MKRALCILGLVGVITLITFLAITRHLAQQRADRLDRALQDAEARVIQLEGEIDNAKHRLAELNPSRGPSQVTAPSAGAGGTTSTVAAPASTSGASARYTTFSKAGLTNLVRIEGTSTVHQWQVEGHLIGGSVELGAGFPDRPGATATPGRVDAKASVFIPVRSLKSVESDGQPYSDPMDEIMYEKLREPTNKRITYNLTSLTLKEQPRSATDPLLYEAAGNLCVAGETNAVTMPVSALPDPSGTIRFSGSLKVKMTDFKITPPSPSLAGVKITTGDEVTLRFIWWVNRISSAQAAR